MRTNTILRLPRSPSWSDEIFINLSFLKRYSRPTLIRGRNENVGALIALVARFLTSWQWRKSPLDVSILMLWRMTPKTRYGLPSQCLDLYITFCFSQEKSEASEAGSQAMEEDYDVDEEYDNDYAENYFDNGEGDDLDDLGGGGGGDQSGGGELGPFIDSWSSN
jgi:hypothetical protein